MSRALRRHHAERMKRRFLRSAYDILGPNWACREAGRYANHGKACSCTMCGNPRRHFGERTIQERRYGL